MAINHSGISKPSTKKTQVSNENMDDEASNFGDTLFSIKPTSKELTDINRINWIF